MSRGRKTPGPGTVGLTIKFSGPAVGPLQPWVRYYARSEPGEASNVSR